MVSVAFQELSVDFQVRRKGFVGRVWGLHSSERVVLTSLKPP